MSFPYRVSRAGARVSAGSRRAGGAVLVTQAIMGAATAGMLVPRSDPVPLVAWQILSAAGTAWFAWRCSDASGAWALAGRATRHVRPADSYAMTAVTARHRGLSAW
jgi:hypothetical protein